MYSKRKIVFALLSVMLAVVCAFSCTACDLFESKHYIIYEYNGASTSLGRVLKGDNYTIPVTPETKFGYTFDGWYDAETGGTKYADADGKSVSPFSGKSDLTLYPQYKPNQYTVKLDYGDAAVTGETTVTALYGQTLPNLPAGLTVTGKDFSGWYTKSNRGGVQVASADGNSGFIFNETNFNINKSEIYLYAGFTAQMRSVTFRTDTGTLIKTVQVEYGSSLADAANSVRVNGLGVLRWKGGASGKVTEDKELIAEEYAPVIELDLNGGKGAKEVIAQAGATVFIPTPEKEASDFLYWEDERGNVFDSTVMPSGGADLKAVWQPKIVFDSNGGNDIQEIVKKAGASVTLPVPERSGYMFAGWFTSDEELYNENTMPADGIALRAGWYIAKTADKVIIPDGKSYSYDNKTALRTQLIIDLSEYLPEDFHGMVKVQGSVKLKHKFATSTEPCKMVLGFYNDKVIGDSTRLMSETYSVVFSTYEKYNFEFEGYLKSNKIYGAAASDGRGGNLLLGMSATYGDFSDLNVSISYPDTSLLYL